VACLFGSHPRLPSLRQAGQVSPAPFLSTSAPDRPQPCHPVVTDLPPQRRRRTAGARPRPCPGAASSSMQSNTEVAKLALPLCPGGFGLRLTTSLVTEAAFLAAAGAAKTRSCGPRRPPSGPSTREPPHCAALTDRWAALHDAAPGLWSPELQVLDAPSLSPGLLHAQRVLGHHLANRLIAALLAFSLTFFDVTDFGPALTPAHADQLQSDRTPCPPPSLSPCPTQTSPFLHASAWAYRLGQRTPSPSSVTAGPQSSHATLIIPSHALALPCSGCRALT
jgi:hypothetical protein